MHSAGAHELSLVYQLLAPPLGFLPAAQLSPDPFPRSLSIELVGDAVLDSLLRSNSPFATYAHRVLQSRSDVGLVDQGPHLRTVLVRVFLDEVRVSIQPLLADDVKEEAARGENAICFPPFVDVRWTVQLNWRQLAIGADGAA